MVTLSKGGDFLGNPGPWGELEISRLVIEPPREFLPKPEEFLTGNLWLFKGYTQKDWMNLLSSSSLNDQQQSILSSPGAWKVTARGVETRPSNDLIFSLSQKSRDRIYSVLSTWPENSMHFEPLRFTGHAKDEWLKDSGLRPEIATALQSLLYYRGTTQVFSDMDAMMPLLHSEHEKIQMMKVLMREETLLVKVRIHQNTNIEALASYWGKGRRRKDLKPFLESLQRKEDRLVDVVHLLPSFARMRLYTFPSPAECAPPMRHDCNWTTLNFFNFETIEQTLNPIEIKRVYEKKFSPVPGTPTFGDVILIGDDSGIVHSCVYIADNIVFTKNGPALSAPWILMKLDDVSAYYLSDRPLKTVILRGNDD